MLKPLSLNVNDAESRPYFLWDEPTTVAEFRSHLASDDPETRARSLQRLLREARFEDVWKFTTPQHVADSWATVGGKLGRRRSFWEFILKAWREHGLIR